MIILSCPECGVPAEVTERFSLASTCGPVDHLGLRCAAGHHFRMPSEKLSAEEQEQLTPRTLAEGFSAGSSHRASAASPDRTTGWEREVWIRHST
jgi:hypothetical protein